MGNESFRFTHRNDLGDLAFFFSNGKIHCSKDDRTALRLGNSTTAARCGSTALFTLILVDKVTVLVITKFFAYRVSCPFIICIFANIHKNWSELIARI